ncbi:DUF3050 domain-containing protein [Solitalea koreensis]|uniref:DUF3050 domain-containing protein n=1 Tax=Solitalea koreensis TaxID=543615 RepID=A0A521BBV9_9SPHI|nr:DUF3050 domain-containing protein [Solitalea koreensis]SMO44594.1 Protein of unknown function [Solitalea koreensis]
MSVRIEQLKKNIEPIRQQLIVHPVYSKIKSIEHLRIFMKHHVYAVWDFMSLLKNLQHGLTCTTAPWKPIGSATTRYLINEIVTGEESDVTPNGERMSHFELYQMAMKQSGADKAQLKFFLDCVTGIYSVENALRVAEVPNSVAQFVNFTFDTIAKGKLHAQAAVFTFGREDLIPDMFISLLKDMDREFPGEISLFKYYIERHIEVDGGHHGGLAVQMTEELCGNDELKWQEAENAVIEALKTRIKLWDGIVAKLN